MTPREIHDDQLARVRSDRAPHDVYPDRATARHAAEAAAASARDMPHLLELDGIERELLADLLQQVECWPRERLGYSAADMDLIRELRDRIRPAYSRERSIRRGT